VSDTALDPRGAPSAALLSEIEGLQLRARETAQGALAGVHRSLRRGASIEFSEHKLYSPGDDIRHVDWRAFAKTDRYHVKQFEDETNLTLELVVDHSGSMRFSNEGRPSKLDYARVVAGALSYLALRQGDATGLTTFAGEADLSLPPRATSSHLLEILSRLVRLAPEGPTKVRLALDRFAEVSRKRSVVVIISDLFDPDPDLLGSFHRLAARRHDVSVLHLVDRSELDFTYESPALFASMEDNRKLFVHPRTLRAAFVEEMKRFMSRTERGLAEAGIDYHRIETGTPAAQALGAFLRPRASRRG
jgi:uncharacterized protein (DUF58 family)